MIRRLAVDVAPLREARAFRLLFASRTVTLLGSQATEVALLLQAKRLTGSPLAVGLLGVAELVPLVAFGLWGGLLADRGDRRRILLGTELGLVAAVGVLIANAALSHPEVWPLYLGALAVMALAALQRPSLDATVPRVVAPPQLPAASALLGISSNVAFIAGASLGGLLAADAGSLSVYALDAASFAVSAACLAALRAPAADRDGAAPAAPGGWGAIAEGVRFVAGRPELLGSYAADLLAMLLASVTALLPFLAGELRATWALGLMYAAGSIGAVLAAALAGWTVRVRRYGRAIAWSAAGWGMAMAGVGVARSVPLVIVLLVAAGAADMYSGIFRDTLWNRTIPDALRGRVAAIELLSYGVGPAGGQLRAGVVASLAGVRAALWSGGVACVLGVGALCGALPGFRRWTAGRD